MFEFHFMAFLEFVEFIGRLSYYFFEETPQHTEWALKDKMLKMIEWMFAPIKLQATDIEDDTTNHYESESDDDY